MYITNIIDYIAKKRELRDAAPERCCLTLSSLQSTHGSTTTAVGPAPEGRPPAPSTGRLHLNCSLSEINLGPTGDEQLTV